MLQKMFPKKDAKVPEIRFAGFEDEWEEKKLASLAEYSNGVGNEKKQTPSGKYELVNLNSISIDGRLKTSNKFVDIAEKTLKINDIVMILSDVGHGYLLGKTALIRKNNYYVLNQRVALLRANISVSPVFLNIILNKNQSYFRLQGAGMSQLNLSKKSVEDFVALYPSLPEQQRIGSFFKSLDDQISELEAKLSQTKQFKQALLQKMFI
nr:restriction endonuclease subunit S [Periweissella fabaria]